MTTPSPGPDRLAPHIDHEVSQLLLLHRQINSLWFRFYPEALRRAAVVAYATHFRALLEFFHDGRPSADDMKAAGCEPRDDIQYSSFAGSARPTWTHAERVRLCDADKLAGHISTGRLRREGAYAAWASPTDLGLLREHIRALLAAAPRLLSRSEAASSILERGAAA